MKNKLGLDWKSFKLLLNPLNMNDIVWVVYLLLLWCWSSCFCFYYLYILSLFCFIFNMFNKKPWERIQLHIKNIIRDIILRTRPKAKLRNQLILHVWAGSRCGGSALCSPSHKMPGHSLISPQARNLHKSLHGKIKTHPVRKTVGTIHFPKSHIYYPRVFTLPSAPKSGLKDFFSLKFLKILTILLLSLMAYLLWKEIVAVYSPHSGTEV